MRWNYRLKAPKIVHPCVGQGKCENSKKKFLRSRYTQYLLINTKSGSVNDVYKNFHNFVAIEQNPPSPFNKMVWNSNCDHFTYISFKKYLGSKDLKTSCILAHPKAGARAQKNTTLPMPWAIRQKTRNISHNSCSDHLLLLRSNNIIRS